MQSQTVRRWGREEDLRTPPLFPVRAGVDLSVGVFSLRLVKRLCAGPLHPSTPLHLYTN